MVLTYVSLAPHVLTPLQFSFAFGANEFWIMLVSAFVNKTIRKAGRPFYLAMGFATMLAGMHLLPDSMQTHWALYMLPVAVSVAGLAFTVVPATSYALTLPAAGWRSGGATGLYSDGRQCGGQSADCHAARGGKKRADRLAL